MNIINRIKRLFGIHIHEWEPWIIGKADVYDYTGKVIGTRGGQFRFCKTCKFREQQLF